MSLNASFAFSNNTGSWTFPKDTQIPEVSCIVCVRRRRRLEGYVPAVVRRGELERVFRGASPSPTSGGPGVEYQRALQLSIPIVQPYWILACHAEKRMIPIANFYLRVSTPSSASFNRPVSMSQASLTRSPVSPSPNQSNKQVPSSYRVSMPVPSRTPDTPPSHASAYIGQPPSARGPNNSRTLATPGEELEQDPELQTAELEQRKSRTGSINMDFRFPQLSTPQAAASTSGPEEKGEAAKKESAEPVHGRRPSAIEVPAPPPVEKEPSFSAVSLAESTDDEVGPTVEFVAGTTF